MKIRPLLVPVLSFSLLACGESTDPGTAAPEGAGDAAPVAVTPAEPSEGGAGATGTDPAQLPDDKEGLAEVYGGLMGQVAAALEGIGSKADIGPALDQIKALKPAFQALMERSEELGLPVDEAGPQIEAVVARLEEALKGVMAKYPMESIGIMKAFTEMTGGVGGR